MCQLGRDWHSHLCVSHVALYKRELHIDGPIYWDFLNRVLSLGEKSKSQGREWYVVLISGLGVRRERRARNDAALLNALLRISSCVTHRHFIPNGRNGASYAFLTPPNSAPSKAIFSQEEAITPPGQGMTPKYKGKVAPVSDFLTGCPGRAPAPQHPRTHCSEWKKEIFPPISASDA